MPFIGNVESTPLKYRWKGVDVFLAKLYRAMRQHQTWVFTHRIFWPTTVVESNFRDRNLVWTTECSLQTITTPSGTSSKSEVGKPQFVWRVISKHMASNIQ